MLTELISIVVASAALSTPAAKDELVKLELHPIERHVVEKTNAERVRRGLRPLKIDMRLMRTARKHGSFMTRTRNFRHGSYGVAENIAMGQANSTAAVSAWMNSSGHRANMLNASHRKIGVSAYRIGNGPIYWTQQFSR